MCLMEKGIGMLGGEGLICKCSFLLRLWSQTGSHRMVPSFSGSLSVALPLPMSPLPRIFPPLYFPYPWAFSGSTGWTEI